MHLQTCKWTKMQRENRNWSPGFFLHKNPWHHLYVFAQESMTSSVGGITIYVYFSFVRVSSTVASQAVKVEHDHNSNISNSQGTEPPSGLTSTGNFSVSTLFNNHYAVRPPFMGSSWNIFGVPTYLNKDPSSANYLYTRRTQKRHHPFWKMFIFLFSLKTTFLRWKSFTGKTTAVANYSGII